MPDKEKQIMERITENVGKLGAQDKERILTFTEGMAFQAARSAQPDQATA